MSDTYYVFDEQAYIDFLSQVLQAYELTEEEALVCAEVAADAAKHGQESHEGAKLWHLLWDFLKPSGAVVPGAKAEPVRTLPSLEVWNGKREIGPTVARRATDRSIEMAQSTGVGIVCVYETNHLLWGGSYALRTAKANCIGGNICHAAACQVVLHGGTRPTSGTHPFSLAFPLAEYPDFFLIDCGTSKMAFGSVEKYRRQGKELPVGVAFDADCRPTVDPDSAKYVAVWGEHKGSGLNAFIEIVMAFFGGSSANIRCVKNLPDGERNTPCFLFGAISAEHLDHGDFAAGRTQAENVMAVVRAAIDESGGARIPGLGKARALESYHQHGGILLSKGTVEHAEFGYQAMAKTTGVKLPTPLKKFSRKT